MLRIMPNRATTVEELRDLINRGEASDPLIFLESVMNGQDPRRLSDIYKLVLEIQDFSDGNPSSSDWAEIVDIVIQRYKYHTIGLSESTAAAKTLSEYLHPKRKHVEIAGGAGSGSVSDDPLSEEEIELFKEKFNDEF